MKAFILAGGFATRLWPLTEKRAKPLLPLAGNPIINYIVANIPDDTSITVGTNAVFEADFNNWKQTQNHPKLEILIEDTSHDDHKLGALGALSKWITDANIAEDILVITGDNYLGFDMNKFLSAYKTGTPLVAGFDIGDLELAKSFGTIILNDDKKTVASFEEKPAKPNSTLVSTGCAIIPQNYLKTLVEYAKQNPDNVGGIFEELISQKVAVDCFVFNEPWFDVGSFDSYLQATQALVGKDSLIDDSSQVINSDLEPSIVIGQKNQVVGSKLENVVMFDYCKVTNCHLRNCVIDNGCVLENVDLTDKMIRAETNLKAKI